MEAVGGRIKQRQSDTFLFHSSVGILHEYLSYLLVFLTCLGLCSKRRVRAKKINIPQRRAVGQLIEPLGLRMGLAVVVVMKGR